MKEPSDQGLEETPSAAEEPEVDAPSAMRRARGAFGFLRAPSFWGGLVVGLVALGVGVAIGLGVDRWTGDDRGQITVHTAKMDHSGEWEGDGPRWPGEKRFRFRFPAEEFGDWREFRDGRDFGKRGWGKDFEGERLSPKDGPGERGGYLSDDELALMERLIDVIEEVVDEIGDYLERGGFDPPGNRPFGPDGFFEGDFWKGFEGRLFGDGSREGDMESESYPDDFWDDDKGYWDDRGGEEGFWDDEEGPLGGFDLPFGEFLPGFAILEDCELDLLELPDILDSLPDQEDGPDGDEGVEEFFGQIEELIREACEQPSGG